MTRQYDMQNIRWFKKNSKKIFSALQNGMKTNKILLMRDLSDALKKHEIPVNHTKLLEYIFKLSPDKCIEQEVIPIYTGRLYDKRALASLAVVKKIIKKNKDEIIEQIRETEAGGYYTTYTTEEKISILIPDGYVRAVLGI